jgi:predicted permease
MIRGISGDFRLASRSLRAAPVVTFAALVTLALGLGAITAMFSIVNALMLRPLPVNDPHRLVTVTSNTALNFGFQAGAGWNYRMWEQLRQRRDVFDGAFAWTVQSVDLGAGGEMQPARALFASGDVFPTLGVPAVLGRTFTSADDVRGGGPDGPVVIISYDFWQRRFNRMPGVIGSRLAIEGIPFTIIGVTPSGFSGVDVGQAFDLALPLGAEPLIRGPRSLVDDERALLLTVMLRLEPRQSVAQATAALRAMQPEIIGTPAPPFLKEPFLVVSASRGISDRSGLRQKYTIPLVAITIVAGLVLLIVCLNVANLLLARAAARRHELSVRLALGAPRLRLARQFLVEGLTLGIIAAALGLAFAVWTSRALVMQLQASAGPARLDLPLDWRVLGFAAAVTAVAVALFGSLPALNAARVPSDEVLRSGGRGTEHGRVAMSAGPIVAQVAISLVLVAAAGLFVRTLDRLARVPLGFNPNGVIVITVNTAHPVIDSAARLLLYRRIIDATAAVPGVTHAAGSVWTPMGGGGGGLLTDARGRRANPNRDPDPVAFNFVSPRWFDTYATATRAGRDISERDDARAQRVAIVNEALSRRLFPDRSGLGETIEAGPCGRDGCTVVGVVADALYSASLRDGPPPTVYLPLAQSAGLTPLGSTSIQITVRTAGDNMRVLPAIADALRSIDRTLVFRARSLEADVAAAFTQERLVAKLAAFFGLVALLLTALGLYAIVAYAVSVRRTEIGIRLALGAQPRRVVALVMRRVCLLGAAGMTLGLAASLWLSRFVAPLVYGLEPRDSASLVTALLTLAAVGAVAAWIPASRAAHVDPARVLRQD